MDIQSKVTKTVKVETAGKSELSTDEWDAILQILLRGELEDYNEYVGANAVLDIDQVISNDFSISRHLIALSRANRHLRKLVIDFVDKRKLQILSWYEIWSTCIDEVGKLINPAFYVFKYEEIAPVDDHGTKMPVYPVHVWMEHWNHTTLIVRIGTQEIGKMTIRRETDPDNKEVHYVTVALCTCLLRC